MTEASVFDWISDELEKRTSLSRLEARGTVRLVLKDAGLAPNTVRTHQMHVVVDRLLASALKKRGVEAADDLCRELAEELRVRGQSASDTATETPYDVFERLDSERSRRPRK